MTPQNLTQPINPAALRKNVLTGAGIALVVILTFVLRARYNPEWGQFWMVRPLIVTPLAGATGGLCFYFADHFRRLFGWNKILITALSVIVYIIGLWLGIVLGLAGTLWH